MKRKVINIILCCGLFLVLSCSKKSKKNAINPTEFSLNSNSENVIKYLTAKKFIDLCLKNYNENKKLNFVVFSGDYPQNWVRKQDVEYLISNVNSKQKCCGYMNVFSSYISSDNAEVGGFAILFIKSYIEKKQLNFGLNSNPKVDEKEVENILNWYKNKNRKPSANIEFTKDSFSK